jgi:hypothetical protein
MAEQLRGPFEKFVDSPYSKMRPSPHLHKVLIRNNKARTHVIALWGCGDGLFFE